MTEDTDPKPALYALWGDLNPDEYPFVHFHVQINPDLPMARRKLVMAVRFDQEVRIVGGYRLVLDLLEVAGGVYLDDMALVASPRAVYIHKLKEILHEIGPSLYEHDPRLGFILESPDARLPQCPLFDPFPLPFPKWEVRDWTVNVPRETPCPICGEKFAAHNKPMWGGGNVCWVHADCWGKGLNKEGNNIVVLDKDSAVGVLQPFNPLSYLTVT